MRAIIRKVVQLETMENEELMLMSYPKSLLCIVGGAAAIAFGGDLTVDAASRIADLNARISD